jgi:hypothetical protein
MKIFFIKKRKMENLVKEYGQFYMDFEPGWAGQGWLWLGRNQTSLEEQVNNPCGTDQRHQGKKIIPGSHCSSF